MQALPELACLPAQLPDALLSIPYLPGLGTGNRENEDSELKRRGQN